ncbi:uncharacterized protein [Dermacentor andersoni]|uniref:uncharacterized protein isoform X3 n=1 Tax=Dermacentor andersoni TaxID=34620 RepID=UPI002417BC11|nr:uncharacterized protein LOC126536057 isoform X3 [Dermacentor andersoni]
MPFDVPHFTQPAVRFPIRIRPALVPTAEGFTATFFRQYASLKSRSALIAASLAIAENAAASVIRRCRGAARAALSGLSPRLENSDTSAGGGGAVAKQRRSRPLEDRSPGAVPHKRRKTAEEGWQGHELLISFCNPGQGVDVADEQSLVTQCSRVLTKVRTALELQMSYETSAFVCIGAALLNYLKAILFVHGIFSVSAQTPEELRDVAMEHASLSSWVSTTEPSSLLLGIFNNFTTLYRAWSIRRVRRHVTYLPTLTQTLLSASNLPSSSSDDDIEIDVSNPNSDSLTDD